MKMDSNLDSILEIEHHMNTNLSVRQKKQIDILCLFMPQQ